MPDLMISKGGIKAAGVSFATEAEQSFCCKSKRNKEHEKAAQVAKVSKNYRDFN